MAGSTLAIAVAIARPAMTTVEFGGNALRHQSVATRPRGVAAPKSIHQLGYAWPAVETSASANHAQQFRQISTLNNVQSCNRTTTASKAACTNPIFAACKRSETRTVKLFPSFPTTHTGTQSQEKAMTRVSSNVACL